MLSAEAKKVTQQIIPWLWHPRISTEGKRQIIDSLFIPALCCQCQTWMLSETHMRKSDVCETRCLMGAVSLTPGGGVRKEVIRQKTQTTAGTGEPLRGPETHCLNRRTTAWTEEPQPEPKNHCLDRKTTACTEEPHHVPNTQRSKRSSSFLTSSEGSYHPRSSTARNIVYDQEGTKDEDD